MSDDKKENAVYQPHNKFFHASMSKKEIAVDFVAQNLPCEMVSCLDLTSFELSKDSFIDPDLAEHYSDLLYEFLTNTKQPIKLYMLFEHKSHPERFTRFQALRYKVKVWDLGFKQKTIKGTLPPIIAIVFYHGQENWNFSTEFNDLYGQDIPEGLQPYLLNFKHILYDLHALDDAQIKGHFLTKMVLLLFKHIGDPDLRSQLPEILGLLMQLNEKQSLLEWLESILKYLSSVPNNMTQEHLSEVLRQVIPNTGESAMATIAEEWIMEGKTEGKAEGKTEGEIEGKQKGIIEVLKARFGVISTAISEAVVNIIDQDVLDQNLRLAATVASLAEFQRKL